MTIALYAGSARSSSTAAGRVTRHSFSFGPHYDPANLGFGPLVCHNDDHLDQPGIGAGRLAQDVRRLGAGVRGRDPRLHEPASP